jgi:hypothetical protein
MIVAIAIILAGGLAAVEGFHHLAYLLLMAPHLVLSVVEALLQPVECAAALLLGSYSKSDKDSG